MTQPDYHFPAIEMKTGIVTRIKNPANGIFGTGTITGSIAPVPTKRIAAIYDSQAGPLIPRFVFGKKDGDPDANGSTTFHAAGIAWSIEGHVYYDQFGSSDGCDELCDRIMRLFKNKVIVLSSPLVCRQLHCRVVTVIPDPVGQHGILAFEAEIQNR